MAAANLRSALRIRDAVQMLTKSEVMGLLVGLARANDADLLNQDACLPSDVCAETDRAAVRRAASLVDHLVKHFSYVETPTFREIVAGKSEAYVKMRTRIECAPARHVEHQRHFEHALANVLNTSDILNLVPEARIEDVETLRVTVASLSNPD